VSAPQLVALDHVSVHFNLGGGGLFGGPLRLLRAVQDVSFSIAPSETLALVGESGSGKSTIGNVVAGLQRPTEGTQSFRGRAMDPATWREARRAIQIVFQDPFSALDPRMPISDIITEPLRIQGIDGRAAWRRRAASLVEQVGLPRDALNRYPHEFSGGQRQRIAIARALAINPRILILDDATASVDATTEARIRVGLREAMRDRTTLIIAHRLSTIALADEIVVLDDGRIAARGTHDDLLESSSVYREIYEHGLLERQFADAVEARRDVEEVA